MSGLCSDVPTAICQVLDCHKKHQKPWSGLRPHPKESGARIQELETHLQIAPLTPSVATTPYY